MLAGGGALSAKLSYDIDRSCAEGGGAPAPEAEGLFAVAGPGSLPPVSSNCCEAASVVEPADAVAPGSMCESCIPGIRKLDVQPFIDTPVNVATAAASVAFASHLDGWDQRLLMLPMRSLFIA